MGRIDKLFTGIPQRGKRLVSVFQGFQIPPCEPTDYLEDMAANSLTIAAEEDL